MPPTDEELEDLYNQLEEYEEALKQFLETEHAQSLSLDAKEDRIKFIERFNQYRLVLTKDNHNP